MVLKLYASLPTGYITRSTISILFGGGTLFCGYQLFTGNEHFYRELAMPLIHRLFDGESAHQIGVKMAKHGLFVGGEDNRKEYSELQCSLFGRQVDNPIGLAAGFDKNAEAIKGLSRSGFGFIEIGSVTPKPQPGNERPRVFRLIEDKAVINSYGFNSDGIGLVIGRVKKAYNPTKIPLGINLGKNKTTSDAVHDYEMGVNYFAPCCDYLVINISSPNTPGLRSLQSMKELAQLLKTLRASIQRSSVQRKPHLLVKISPDLTQQELADIAEICLDRQCRADGLIVTNTTIQRPAHLKSGQASQAGGLSGVPLRDLSTQCISEIYRLTKGQIPIIGCGGISNGSDAYEKIRAGARAVQLYTAIVYQGFPVVGRVKRELAELLRHDGYSNIAEAVGRQHHQK